MSVSNCLSIKNYAHDNNLLLCDKYRAMISNTLSAIYFCACDENELLSCLSKNSFDEYSIDVINDIIDDFRTHFYYNKDNECIKNNILLHFSYELSSQLSPQLSANIIEDINLFLKTKELLKKLERDD
jgi:hypothetical protein